MKHGSAGGRIGGQCARLAEERPTDDMPAAAVARTLGFDHSHWQHQQAGR